MVLEVTELIFLELEVLAGVDEEEEYNNENQTIWCSVVIA